MTNKHGGDYYVIELYRGDFGPLRERFEIGVNGHGFIIHVTYDGHRIQQWNGLEAEPFALQMTQESDPVWSRSDDYFPGGRSGD